MERRNNAFPKAVITPFINYFHAQHLLNICLILRTLAIIKIVNLVYIGTAYLAQIFDLYVRMFRMLHWIWKGVGVRKKTRVFFQLFNGYFLFIFNFISVEPIHKSIYVLHVNRTYFICTYMTSPAFSGFQIAKINKIYNSFQIISKLHVYAFRLWKPRNFVINYDF